MRNNLLIGYGFIALSSIVDLLFSLVEWPEVKDSYFCWTGHCFMGPIYKSTYYYHYFAYISIMCRLYAAYRLPKSRIFTWLIWLEIVDMIDYAITFNTAYRHVYPFGYDVSLDFNLPKTLVTLILVKKEYSNGIRSILG